MKKVKKIKKIPKYFDGTQSIAAIKDPIKTKANESGNAALSAPLKQPDALTKHNAQQMSNALNKNYGTSPSGGGNGTAAAGGSGFGGRWGQFGAAATAGGKMLMNTFGVKDNSSAGVTLNKSMEGAEIGGAIMPGWGHLIGGVAGGLIGGFSGAKFDKSLASTTGNAADWVTHGGIFNDNYDEKVREASMYQNSLMAAEQTANKQLEWANDPRNQGMVSMLKEGGIVPGEHYASRNEVEVDANGNNAVRYKWDPKGKDTYRIMFNPDGSLTEGNMIFNDEGVRRPDSTKYSDTADKMIKNIKDPKLRKISLKKLAAEQEEQKAKEGKTKNGIPAYEGGDYGEPTIIDWLREKTKGTILGKSLNSPENGDTRSELDIVRDRLRNYREYGDHFESQPVVDGYDQSFNRYSPTGTGLSQFGSSFKLFGEGALKPRRNLFGFDVSTTVQPTAEKTKKAATTGTRTKQRSTVTIPAVELDPVNIDERIATTVDKSKYALYNPDATANDVVTTNFKPIETPITGKVRNRPTLKAALKNLASEDSLYKMASIFTPLFDREKAETTRLERPTWYGTPVAVDRLNQLQDAQLGYALANYNTAQGGYTAGQQLAARGAAASNLARQRAQIHQWQTEQQNKNIAQNIASYNVHANVLAEIANKESDINAANRASARKINRQGRTTALKNWGQILRNEKQYAMDDVRMAALEPLLQYAYENPEQIKKLINRA